MKPLHQLALAFAVIAIAGATSYMTASAYKPQPVTIVQPVETKYVPVPVTLEYTKGNELQPPVHIEGPTSIHFITDDERRLTDVQIFPVP